MKRRLVAALVPALMIVAGVAQAQPAPPEPRAQPIGADMQARIDARRTQHMDDMRTILRLRPDQEAALRAFVEAHKPPPRDVAPPPADMTTPQRLETMAKREAEMRAEHDRMREALAKFYAALSPEQQKVFDALQRLHGPPPRPGPDDVLIRGGPGRPMMMMHGPGPGAPPERDPPR